MKEMLISRDQFMLMAAGQYIRMEPAADSKNIQAFTEGASFAWDLLEEQARKIAQRDNAIATTLGAVETEASNVQ